MPLVILLALVVSVVADAASPVICPLLMLLFVSVCVPARVTSEFAAVPESVALLAVPLVVKTLPVDAPGTIVVLGAAVTVQLAPRVQVCPLTVVAELASFELGIALGNCAVVRFINPTFPLPSVPKTIFAVCPVA